MSANVGSATGYLDLDISGFLAGLQSAQGAANLQTKNIATTIGNNISKIGNGLTTVGTTLTKTVTVPILGIGAAGLKTAMDFEKGMSEVKAISGATGKEFEALKDVAIDLGATTAFSAGEVAEAMTEMAKAGWDSQQIIAGMGGVLDAAAASGESLATVSTIVADAITGFGMQASESTKVADLLTQAANSGTIGITDLGESFKYIAPLASSMGLNIEDVTTAIAAMSMSGIKGSQAGTALRTTLTNLVKPTDQMATAMEELGISVTNSDGTMKSLDGIVTNLRESFDGLTEAEKAQYAATLAGKEGMSGLLSILNLTQEEYDAIAESMYNANGVAKETAEIMQDNLQSKVEQLGGSLESLAIKLGDLVIPYVQQFVLWLTSLVDKFSSLDTETQKTILKFAAIAVAAGPVLTVAGKLVSGFGSVITTFGKIPGAIKTLTGGFAKIVTSAKNVAEGFKLAKAGFTALGASASPLGAALAGITAPMVAIAALVAVLIAAFVSLWKNNEEFRDKIIAIWEQVKATFEKLFSGIVDRLNGFGFEFESVGEVLKSIWSGFCNFLAPIFEGAFQMIANIFDYVVNQILAVLDFWIAVFKGDWEGAWNAVKAVFSNIWDAIVNIFQTVGDTLLGILDVVCGWFGTTWEETWSAIQDFFVNVWNGILTFFSNVWNGIKNALSNALNAVKTAITNGFNAVKSFITNIWDNIKTATTNTWDAIKEGISSRIEAARALVSNIVSAIKAVMSGDFEAAKGIVIGIFDDIKSSISEKLENAKQIVSSAIEKIKGFFDFEWELPKLKMPHFSISGKFSLNPPSVPSISVEWYKKAMAGGMILNSPTIFGYDPTTGQFLGGGEAGSETVIGTSNLMKMIRNAVADVIKPMIEATYQMARVSYDLGYITNNAFARQTQIIEEIFRGRGNDPTSGGTFIFNSPDPIDEVEAAYQMKKAVRELAEGF